MDLLVVYLLMRGRDHHRLLGSLHKHHILARHASTLAGHGTLILAAHRCRDTYIQIDVDRWCLMVECLGLVRIEAGLLNTLVEH